MPTQKSFIYIANWKSYFTFSQTLQFCTDNVENFKDLARATDNTIIICPSFDALYPVNNLFKESHIKLGAQNCSCFDTGPYTGEISAQSLVQLGCAYAIIGHSERRMLLRETEQDIATKAVHLLEHKITPIICIGETSSPEESLVPATAILQRQLDPVLQAIKQHAARAIIIAYEPAWVIGTDSTPDKKELETTCSWIKKYCAEQIPTIKHSLVYGGNVHETNIQTLKTIHDIDGFLIGRASLDFQKFEKIVSLC